MDSAGPRIFLDFLEVMFCASLLDQSLQKYPTKANDIWEPPAAETDPSGADSWSVRPFSIENVFPVESVARWPKHVNTYIMYMQYNSMSQQAEPH